MGEAVFQSVAIVPSSWSIVILQLQQIGIANVSTVNIFTTDATGSAPSLIESISILQRGILPEVFLPQLTLDNNQIAEGQSLQVELIETDGTSRVAPISLISNSQDLLDFEQGTVYPKSR